MKYLRFSILIMLFIPLSCQKHHTVAAQKAAVCNFSIVSKIFTTSSAKYNLLFTNGTWQTSALPVNELIILQVQSTNKIESITIKDAPALSHHTFINSNGNSSTVLIMLNAKNRQKFLTYYNGEYQKFMLKGKPLHLGKLKINNQPAVLVRQKQEKTIQRAVNITARDTLTATVKESYFLLSDSKKIVWGKRVSQQLAVAKAVFNLKTNTWKKINQKCTVGDNAVVFDNQKYPLKVSDTALVLLKDLYPNFIFELRYATTNNFMHEKMYPCAQCLLRYNVAKDLVQAAVQLEKQNLRIKIFDCYRPLSVQKKMWEKVHNINYVAPPQKGSMHNRGAAVDLTLATQKGKELEMGTPFDYFGPQAATKFPDLPARVLKNRQLLDSVLLQHNFRPIRTEWWHFYHSSAMKYNVLDVALPCGETTE